MLDLSVWPFVASVDAAVAAIVAEMDILEYIFDEIFRSGADTQLYHELHAVIL